MVPASPAHAAFSKLRSEATIVYLTRLNFEHTMSSHNTMKRTMTTKGSAIRAESKIVAGATFSNLAHLAKKN